MTSPTATADLIEFRLRNIGEADRQHEPPMTWAEAAALLAALRAAEAERDGLRADRDSHQRVAIAAMEALAPFADAANHMEKCRDDRPLWIALNTGWAQREHVPLTVGDLRRARAALQSTSAKEGG